MQITNFNYLSAIIFIMILLWGVILFYNFFSKREKLKNQYSLLFKKGNYYYLKYISLLLSVVIMSLWIFTIKYWEKTTKQEVNWIDISFVLDVSKSMNALDFIDWDYSVSRLSFTKALMWEYIANNPGNRYWLVIFAGDAISSSPLTSDHSTFLTFLQNVDYKNLNTQWTNLEKAVELWVERLYSQKWEQERAKAMIVLSDWWDEWEKVNYTYIEWLIQNKQMSNFIIWIWKKTWAKIPVWQDVFWNISYQTYKWESVITKLNSPTLKSLSRSLKWQYIAANKVNDLEKVSIAINALEKKALEIGGWENKKDFSRILGIIAAILFIFYILLHSHKKELK